MNVFQLQAVVEDVVERRETMSAADVATFAVQLDRGRSGLDSDEALFDLDQLHAGRAGTPRQVSGSGCCRK